MPEKSVLRARVCVCKLVLLQKQGERSHFISYKTSFRENVYLIFFLFLNKIDLCDCGDCSKDLMENKFKSIWNSSVDWLGLPSLSPCLFVFRLQEGSGSCWLNKYLFCLLLQTSWRGSHCSCSEIGQTWNSCAPSFPQKSKSMLVLLPSNMFYNLLPWYGVLCVFFLNHYFHWTTVQVLY